MVQLGGRDRKAGEGRKGKGILICMEVEDIDIYS